MSKACPVDVLWGLGVQDVTLLPCVESAESASGEGGLIGTLLHSALHSDLISVRGIASNEAVCVCVCVSGE